MLLQKLLIMNSSQLKLSIKVYKFKFSSTLSFTKNIWLLIFCKRRVSNLIRLRANLTCAKDVAFILFYIPCTWEKLKNQINFRVCFLLTKYPSCSYSRSSGSLFHLLGTISRTKITGRICTNRIWTRRRPDYSIYHAHVCVRSILLSIHHSEPAPLQYHV